MWTDRDASDHLVRRRSERPSVVSRGRYLPEVPIPERATTTDSGRPDEVSVERAAAQFLEWIPAIDRAIAGVTRRHALAAGDADDFSAWARTRVTENDFAIVRKFAGRSAVSTYLAVVISNLLHDYRNAKWGRWRPSAAAQRMGPVGIRLEEMIVRDRCPVREAIAMLRSAGAAETEGELARMSAQIAKRVSDVDVTIEHASELAAPGGADVAARSEERARVVDALHRAVNALPDEDRLITHMRFWGGLSVVEVARLLRVESKPLYRRLEGIEKRLNAMLQRYGVAESDVRELLAEDTVW